MRLQNVRQGGRSHKIHTLKAFLADTGDVIKTYQPLEVGGNGDFVGRVEGAGSIASAADGFIGKARQGNLSRSGASK